MKHTPLRRRSINSSNLRSKAHKKQTLTDLKREWQVPIQTNLRYSGIKGIFWYYFSIFVRHRDINEWGTCISCGKPITIESCDAGHFMPASNCGILLLFDHRNVNAECKGCNGFDKTHLLGYAKNLDIRYGTGTSQGLIDRRDEYRHGPPVKDFSVIEYAQMIRALPNYVNNFTED